MSGFSEASAIEKEGLVRLWPYLESISHDGKFIMTTNGTLAKRFQASVGDVLVAGPDHSCWAIEIKVEQKHTGNLFLETWSNRNLEQRDQHALRGSNVGWLFKLVGDRLLYLFLDTNDLYSIDIYSLKRWAFVAGGIYSCREVEQASYDQLNDTWGRLAPISQLQRELPENAFSHCVLPEYLEAA